MRREGAEGNEGRKERVHLEMDWKRVGVNSLAMVLTASSFVDSDEGIQKGKLWFSNFSNTSTMSSFLVSQKI